LYGFSETLGLKWFFGGRDGAILTPNELVFTALHGIQMPYSDEKAVRLSVARVNRDKTKKSLSRILHRKII